MDKKEIITDEVMYVYYLKVFAILLVVIGHTNTIFTKFIYSFHMPLFFFISGYFLKVTDISNILRRDFRKLLCPYFLFALLSIIVASVKNVVLGREHFLMHDMFLGIIYGMDLSYVKTYGFVLWFLLALFIARAIATYLISQMSFLKSLILLFTLGWIVKEFKLPLCLSQGILGGFWVALGYAYFNRIKGMIKNQYVSHGLIFLTMCLIAIQIPNVNIADLKMDNYLYYVLYNVLILFSIDLFFSRFGNNYYPIITKMGKATMFIFIVHPYTNNIGHILSKGIASITLLISGSILLFFYCLFDTYKIKRGLT